MTANGLPVEDQPLERPAVQISASLAFEELQAATALGLTFDEYQALPGTMAWVDPDNPTLSKCEVIAWYRLSGRVQAVSQQAAARQAKRKS